MHKEISIFFRGSRTFFVSSLFFPRQQRQDVIKLYSFLRVVDDCIDRPKPNKAKFNKIRALWEAALKPGYDATPHWRDPIELKVIKNILNLTKKYNFDPAWVEAFFDSMQMDLNGKKYKTLDEALTYVYGSAEVVGLMMARIMRLPPEADKFAKLQGRAFQWINFIRDIEEDNQLGRQYFPAKDLKRFNLKDLSQKTAHDQPDDFKNFMQFQLGRYKKWQHDAQKGYKYIPPKPLKAINLASSANNWISDQIFHNSLIVFSKKVRPNRLNLLLGVQFRV